MTDDPWTYFGLWSKDKCESACKMLQDLKVRFQVREFQECKEILESWDAWDPTASNPNLAYDLYIHDNDVKVVGSKLVEAFPERASKKYAKEK